jgi:hypothetical protein
MNNTEMPLLVKKYLDPTIGKGLDPRYFSFPVKGEHFWLAQNTIPYDAGFGRGTNFYDCYMIYDRDGKGVYASEEKFVYHGDTGDGLNEVKEKNFVRSIKIIEETPEKLTFGWKDGFNTITIAEFSNDTKTVSIVVTFDQPKPVYQNQEHMEYAVLTNKIP